MQFLIIDDDADYRAVLRYHLDVEWPDADIDDYQPVSAGLPPATFDLRRYDALLLAHPIGGERGFEWLAGLLERDCPPVIVFAEPSDEFLAVDALKAGAASYFPKAAVTHRRLIATIRAELGAPQHAAETTLTARNALGSARNYSFLETLHSSDQVSVYLAAAEDDGRRLAFKVIRYVPDSGSERLFDRFLQEYDVIAHLDHPNVVKIFDLGVADDHAYIAMEYLPGGSLADRLNCALRVDQALDYTRQIACALEVIHGSGILHRDLKPGNIMFRDDETLALIDFGLAKQVKLEAAITGAGQIFGTPYYMSPEQGHAESADERGDIYSLGCIFHEMLTGSRPFTAASAMGVIYKHAHAPRPQLEGSLRALQKPLDLMLAARPDERYQSVSDLLADLTRL
jgi:DNA-binding response OmpR family regulator